LIGHCPSFFFAGAALPAEPSEITDTRKKEARGKGKEKKRKEKAVVANS
jgi:hypothetical protein